MPVLRSIYTFSLNVIVTVVPEHETLDTLSSGMVTTLLTALIWIFAFDDVKSFSISFCSASAFVLAVWRHVIAFVASASVFGLAASFLHFLASLLIVSSFFVVSSP